MSSPLTPELIERLTQTREQRDRRRLDEIEHLRQRGVATFADEAEAFELRRKMARRDFRGDRHG